MSPYVDKGPRGFINFPSQFRRKRYLCVGGYVISADGDRHYVPGHELVRLYQVNGQECICVDPERHPVATQLNLIGISEDQLSDLVHLHPKQDGNYTLPPVLQLPLTRDVMALIESWTRGERTSEEAFPILADAIQDTGWGDEAGAEGHSKQVFLRRLRTGRVFHVVPEEFKSALSRWYAARLRESLHDPKLAERAMQSGVIIRQLDDTSKGDRCGD